MIYFISPIITDIRDILCSHNNYCLYCLYFHH